jgi:outer membrane protein assembly factor BamA
MVIRTVLVVLALSVTGRAGMAGPTVREITLVGNSRTDSTVIVRELLYEVGEPLDTALVEESERNLRRLLFLGKVKTVLTRDGESVDVEVHLEDLYARVLTPQLAGEVGELSYGIVALDYNLLGRGQVARIDLNHNAVTGNSGSLFYQNPRLRGSRHAMSANLGLAEEGHNLFLSFSQPFYALSTPWSYGASASRSKDVARLYSGQHLTAEYADRREAASLWVTRSFGDRTKLRPGLRVTVSNQGFDSKQGFSYAPEDRRRILPSVGFTVWEPEYEKTTFVFDLGRVEDIQLGSWISTRIGASSENLGSDRSFGFFQLQLSPIYKHRQKLYVFGTALHSSRLDRSGSFHRYTAVSVKAYKRLLSRHTIALRLWWDTQGDREDQSQLLLGVDRGLRGYAPRRFDGSRRFLLNLEARPTFHQNRTYVVAGAMFADVGSVWSPGDRRRRMAASAGIGARIGLLTVYNAPILRTDIARGFLDNSWQLSLGLGQYF